MSTAGRWPGWTWALPAASMLLAAGALGGGLLADYFQAPAQTRSLLRLVGGVLLWTGALPSVLAAAACVLGPRDTRLAKWMAEVFVAGALVAVVSAGEATLPALVARAVCLAVIGWRMLALRRAMAQKAPSFLPPHAVLSQLPMLVGWLAIGGGVCDVAAVVLGPSKLEWIRQAIYDTLLLAVVVPIATAARTAWPVSDTASPLAVVLRWPSYLQSTLALAAAALPLSAWLWRFPGAGATPGAVAVAVGLMVLAVLLVAPRRSPVGPWAAAWVYATGLTMAVVSALTCYAVDSAAIGLRQNWPLLREDPIGLWVLGYRWALAFAAAGAAMLWLQAQMSETAGWRAGATSLLVGCGACAAAIAHWRWMVGPPQAATGLWIVVVIWTAVAIAAAVGVRPRKSATDKRE